MKKDRNAFFESTQSASSFAPNMMPYQAASNSSSFYAGPDIPFNTYPNINNDYDNKISRLERQMQKLENRISKLENMINAGNSNDDINISSNMYML